MSIFQTVVDVSQKQPHWWARQATLLGAVAYLLSFAFNSSAIDGWRVLDVLCYVLVVICLLYQTSTAARCSGICVDKPTRMLFWFMATVYSLAGLILLTPESLAYGLSIVCLASTQSFAACTPPKPPRPGGYFKPFYAS